MRTITLLALLVIGISAHAQSTGLGLKAGVSVSSIKALNLRTDPNVGATAGVYIPWGFGPRMELQPELAITMLGGQLTEPDGDRFRLRMYYFQVPLTFKLFLSNAVHINVGYQVGKTLYVQDEREGLASNVTDRYKAFDMGFVGGIGLDLPSGLDLDLRLYGAMSPSLRNDDALFPKNRAVLATVGYRIVQFSRRHHFHKRR